MGTGEGVPVCHRAACTTVHSLPYQGQDGAPYVVEEMVVAASAWSWVDPQEQKGKLRVDDE